jgi:hypothetical protein
MVKFCHHSIPNSLLIKISAPFDLWDQEILISLLSDATQFADLRYLSSATSLEGVRGSGEEITAADAETCFSLLLYLLYDTVLKTSL